MPQLRNPIWGYQIGFPSFRNPKLGLGGSRVGSGTSGTRNLSGLYQNHHWGNYCRKLSNVVISLLLGDLLQKFIFHFLGDLQLKIIFILLGIYCRKKIFFFLGNLQQKKKYFLLGNLQQKKNIFYWAIYCRKLSNVVISWLLGDLLQKKFFVFWGIYCWKYFFFRLGHISWSCNLSLCVPNPTQTSALH